MEQQHWAWLVDSVRYFRAMDFFVAEHALSDEELVSRIVTDEQEKRRESGGRPFWERPEVERLWEPMPPSGNAEMDEDYEWLSRPRRDRRDFNLVLRDKSRIWFEDGEGDICPGEEIYVRTVQEWSRISRGAFLPTDVREVWINPDGWSVGEPDCQVVIHFLLAGRECILEPWSGYGWLDFGLLNGINPLIAASGYAYEEWDGGGFQETCLVVLTDGEKRRLTEERGWEFSNVAVRGYGFREGF